MGIGGTHNAVREVLEKKEKNSSR